MVEVVYPAACLIPVSYQESYYTSFKVSSRGRNFSSLLKQQVISEASSSDRGEADVWGDLLEQAHEDLTDNRLNVVTAVADGLLQKSGFQVERGSTVYNRLVVSCSRLVRGCFKKRWAALKENTGLAVRRLVEAARGSESSSAPSVPVLTEAFLRSRVGFSSSQSTVHFEPFVGIGPRRFFDLFSIRLGAGYEIRVLDLC